MSRLKISSKTLSLAALAVVVVANAGNVSAQEWGTYRQDVDFAPPPQDTMTRTPSYPRSSSDASSTQLPFAMSVGAGVQHNSFVGKSEGDGLFYGAHVSFGGYLTTRRKGWRDISLSVDAGVFQGDYDTNVFGRTYPYEGGLAYTQGSTARGVVRRKNEQYHIPLSLIAAYNIQANKYLTLRVGAVAGATYYSLDSTFEWQETIFDPNHNQVHFDRLTFAKRSNDGFLFSGGGMVGASINFTRSFSLELQYRLLWTHNLKVGQADRGDENFVSVRAVNADMLSHQATLSAVWRF